MWYKHWRVCHCSNADSNGANDKSLIAIMLGRLRMDIPSCIEAYSNLSDSVFRRVAHRTTWKGNVQARFDSNALELVIKDIVTQQGLNEDALLNENTDPRCKV
jgi:hypothetical protein